jgi:hypothetical protein
MAGTIVTSLTCAIINGSFKDDPNIQPITIAQSAVGGGNPGTITITTSEADITIGLTSPRFCIIENLDDTNYFTIGPKSAGAMVALAKLKPGEFAVIPLAASVTLRAIANTASVKARIRAYED